MGIYKNFNRWNKTRSGFELKNKFNLDEKLRFKFKGKNVEISHLVGKLEIITSVVIPRKYPFRSAILAIQHRYKSVYGDELIDWK